MFYKKENDNWLVGIEVSIPNIGIFTEANKDDIPKPWFWSDNEPKEYKEWVEEQEKEMNDFLEN